MGTNLISFDRTSTSEFGTAARPLQLVGGNGGTVTAVEGEGPAVSVIEGGLEAQNMHFQSSAVQSSANWMAVQDSNDTNFLDADQIGILDQSDNIDGCSTLNRPTLFAEVAEDGAYLNAYCAPGYVFGPGTFTYFNLAWYPWGGGTWVDSVSWNGTWNEIIAATFGTTALAKDTVAYPSTAFEEQNENAYKLPAFDIGDIQLMLEFTYGTDYQTWTGSNEAALEYQNPGVSCVTPEPQWSVLEFRNC